MPAGADWWAAVISYSRPANAARTGQEHQPELADLHLVAVGEDRGVDRFTVHVGAVEASDVDHLEVALVLTELGVPAADGHVVEEDVAVGMPSRRRRRLVEQKARTRIRVHA